VRLFDRFASTVSTVVARAPFFLACVLLVIVWLPSYFLLASADTWQLIINTVTTIITFLLVALLQNTQARQDNATNGKLDAQSRVIAELAYLLYRQQPELQPDLLEAVNRLRKAVGLEDEVSA
jgi:low affinity Fe/Cu permease